MIQPHEILIRLLLAAFLGGVIGVNRGRLEWAAGLRTHMLVSVGAALAMIVSAFGFADVLTRPDIVLDPSRIAAQVISGVGFLGAGTILFLQREQVIRGLTTAAGLWAVSAIGLAAGSGLFLAATIATAVIWVILALLKPIERRFIQTRNRRPRVSARLGGAPALAAVEEVLSRHHLATFKIILRRQDSGEDIVDILFERSVRNEQIATLVDSLRQVEGLRSVSYAGADEARMPPA
ncbi:MAG: MgtC/SapB family protein [Rhodanobacter sp.]|nr:MAG: MgtC/SapB family protein [Rhodanobacter sp.]TAL89060.1 MAG: MgtC/SapB family protein [Rhodanobacter sp.]TAM40555.1 MAG: MgtC/SapB family protein [Rhodanobacter sp.]TAN28630.1 MAG: MgtC/SapB family protein [Rhodanobacter sp.]